jgi:lantibiotic transport system ATP-binding protein
LKAREFIIAEKGERQQCLSPFSFSHEDFPDAAAHKNAGRNCRFADHFQQFAEYTRRTIEVRAGLRLFLTSAKEELGGLAIPKKHGAEPKANMDCIETIDLTHKFSDDETALRRVNLRVPANSIYGFLGPNGAGKTTTLKLILGLLKKQAGEITVFGKPFAANRVETLRRIGSMIESPSIYTHLTAAENLKILQKVYGCAKERTAEVLELVGLAGTGHKRAGQFSLGMKQRLSIAIALLHAPSLLILDEPTNGLDPNGILEIRELLQSLNKNHGITILISSHLLSEIERMVTHVGIINRGQILFQGTLPELVNKRRQNSFVVFETNDAAHTLQITKSFGFNARLDAARVLIPEPEKEQIAAVNQKLVASGIEVYAIGKIEDDLEKIFFDLLGE